jgi:hypothetical protein
MAKVFGYAKSATTASKSSLALRFPRAATPKTYANGSTQAIPPNRLPVGSPEPASAVEHGNGDTWKLVGIACTFKTLDGCNDDGFTLYIYTGTSHYKPRNYSIILFPPQKIG